ncbi:MAG TPA: radical SAM protein [bacterium]
MSVLRDLIGVGVTEATRERQRDRLLRLAARLPRPLVRAGVALHRALWRASRSRDAGAPDTLFFFVTNICNQSCVHCFYAAELNRPTQAMKLEDVRALARSIRGRTPTVFLCGGEPTTRRDLPDIAEAFIRVAKVRRLFITTNGILQDRVFATVERALALPGRFQLRMPVSLDGPEPMHDAIRKFPGGFRKATETLERLLERATRDPRLVPMITSVIQKGNAEGFAEFYRSLRTRYDCEVQFILIRQDGRDAGGLDKTILLDAGNAEDLLPDPDTCRRILRDIEAFEAARPSPSLMPAFRASMAEHHLTVATEHRAVAPCVAPQSFATISPDGGTSLCELAKPYGNLRDFGYDLRAAWNSPAANGQRAQLSACWCTYPCALQNSVMRDPTALTTSLDYVRKRLT